MATIIFFQDGRNDFPGSRNTVSVDGGRPFSMLGNMFKYYKLDRGEHTVVITSSNGSCWEITEDIGYSDCLNIKVQIDRDSNIMDVAHKVATEPSTVLFPKKLPK